MPRMFVSKSGGAYPATLADWKRAKAGEKAKAKYAEALPGVPFAAPYQEVIASLLANGFEEVKDSGIPERQEL